MLKCSLWETYTGKFPQMHTHLLVTDSLLLLTYSFRLTKVQTTDLFKSVSNFKVLPTYM